MVNLYCTLIINKRRTFDQVPKKLQDEVKMALNELGYNTNGDKIVMEE